MNQRKSVQPLGGSSVGDILGIGSSTVPAAISASTAIWMRLTHCRWAGTVQMPAMLIGSGAKAERGRLAARSASAPPSSSPHRETWNVLLIICGRPLLKRCYFCQTVRNYSQFGASSVSFGILPSLGPSGLCVAGPCGLVRKSTSVGRGRE